MKMMIKNQIKINKKYKLIIIFNKFKLKIN